MTRTFGLGMNHRGMAIPFGNLTVYDGLDGLCIDFIRDLPAKPLNNPTILRRSHVYPRFCS